MSADYDEWSIIALFWIKNRLSSVLCYLKTAGIDSILFFSYSSSDEDSDVERYVWNASSFLLWLQCLFLRRFSFLWMEDQSLKGDNLDMFVTCPIYLKGKTDNYYFKAVTKIMQPWSTDRSESTNIWSYIVHLLRTLVMCL